MPSIHFRRAEDGQFTICILVGGTEQERFIFPGWDPQHHGPPLASWMYDYYALPEQERRDKHQGRFEKYALARFAAAQLHPEPVDDVVVKRMLD
jgi:hypothetical protein